MNGQNIGTAVALIAVCWTSSAALPGAPRLVKSEFVFESARFQSAHASTILATSAGLVAAWFGGTREGAPDVGIWLSHETEGVWDAPSEVANGSQSDGRRFPCWNPVLFQPRGGPVLLFYKVGPSPREWWGMVRSSSDSGRTWSDARRLPDGILGPIKNKPVQLGDGTIVSGSSTESSDSPSLWRVHFERSTDGGQTWTRIDPARGTSDINAIQPSILLHPRGVLQAIGRTRSGRIFETWSHDSGLTWGALALTELPNPNSGIDAVTLQDGRQLVVYNHTVQGRTPLNVAISSDGKTWQPLLVLEQEPGEYSYPAVIQTGDGLVHVTYTWKRQRIKHAVISVQ
jgi:predicted neuraminidase